MDCARYTLKVSTPCSHTLDSAGRRSCPVDAELKDPMMRADPALTRCSLSSDSMAVASTVQSRAKAGLPLMRARPWLPADDPNRR